MSGGERGGREQAEQTVHGHHPAAVDELRTQTQYQRRRQRRPRPEHAPAPPVDDGHRQHADEPRDQARRPLVDAEDAVASHH
jgi:hypothetical protein